MSTPPAPEPSWPLRIAHLLTLLCSVIVGLSSALMWIPGVLSVWVGVGLMGAGRREPFELAQCVVALCMGSFVFIPPVLLAIGVLGVIFCVALQRRGRHVVLGYAACGVLMGLPWLHALFVVGVVYAALATDVIR